MKGFTYSSIIGATILFMAVLVTFLWIKAYNDLNLYVEEQKEISKAFIKSPIEEFLINITYYKNIKDIIKLNETACSDILVFKPFLENNCQKGGFNCEFLVREGNLIGLIIKNYSGSFKNGIYVKELKFKNFYDRKLVYLGYYPTLPRFFCRDSIINFSINLTEMENSFHEYFQYYPFLSEILKDIKNEYTTYDVEEQKDICSEIEKLNKVKPSESEFIGTNTVKIIEFLNYQFQNYDTCKKRISLIKRIAKNFTFLINCQSRDCKSKENSGVIFYPKKSVLEFDKIEKTGLLKCDKDGEVIEKPSFLNSSIASKICEEAKNKKDLFCLEKEEELESGIESCFSDILNFSKCAKEVIYDVLNFFNVPYCIIFEKKCILDPFNFVDCAKTCLDVCYEKEISITVKLINYSIVLNNTYYVYDLNYLMGSKKELKFLVYEINKKYLITDEIFKE